MKKQNIRTIKNNNLKKAFSSFYFNRRGVELPMAKMVGFVLALIVILVIAFVIYKYYTVPNKFITSCEFSGGIMIKNQDSCPPEKPFVSVISERSNTGNKCCVSSIAG